MNVYVDVDVGTGERGMLLIESLRPVSEGIEGDGYGCGGTSTR